MIRLNFCADFAIEYVVFWRNLHHWQKIYTAAGSDGSDKSHPCVRTDLLNPRKSHIPS